MTLREHLSISVRGVRHMLTLSKRFTVCLLLSAFLSAITPYVPIYFSAKILDGLQAHAAPGALMGCALLTVGLTFALRVLSSALDALKSAASADFWRASEWLYAEKAMEMAYASMESKKVKALHDRIKKESQTGYNLFYLQRYAQSSVSCLTKIAASLTLSASFFFLPGVPLSARLLIVAGLIAAVGYGLFDTKKCAAIDGQFMEACVDANVRGSKYYEYINDYSAGKDIRLYGMGEHLAQACRSDDQSIFDLLYKADLRQLALNIPTQVITQGLKFGVYLALIAAAQSGQIAVGSIAKYVTCLLLLCSAVRELLQTAAQSFINHAYLKRYFSYFDLPNAMRGGTQMPEKRGDGAYTVEFRNVSFRYPNADADALRGVNFRFRTGEKLAIVGMNGSGKTTFIKLLCRLYDPTEGEILLNGVNIKAYDDAAYMLMLSVVFQDFRLFAFSLGENVAASAAYDRARAAECLVKAGFGDRLSALPDGLDTYLYRHYSDQGVEISGGEAQKIALARALYKEAPFIVLDEPTAALDPVSEYEIYSKFSELVGDRTAIYISHRLASCRFCDTIAVFDHGELVQSGSHAALLADERGQYHALWNAQAQYYAG